MSEVVYKPINDFPDYLVGNDGSIMSKRKNGKWKKLKGIRHKNGYMFVDLYNDNRHKLCSIHRLVAKAFIPNVDNLPYINHKDETRDNNCVDNLEWCTHEYNINYGTCQERKAKAINYHTQRQLEAKQRLKEHNSKPVLQFDKDGNFVKRYKSTMDIQRTLGYGNGLIGMVCRGKRQSAYGYIWKYEEVKEL